MSDGDPSDGLQRLRARVASHLDIIYGDDHDTDLDAALIEAMRYAKDVAEPEPYQNYWDQSLSLIHI